MVCRYYNGCKIVIKICGIFYQLKRLRLYLSFFQIYYFAYKRIQSSHHILDALMAPSASKRNGTYCNLVGFIDNSFKEVPIYYSHEGFSCECFINLKAHGASRLQALTGSINK